MQKSFVFRDSEQFAPDAPFVGSLRPKRRSPVLSRHTLRRRFKTACRVLGLDRLAMMTIHPGRHTFISHALAGKRTLAEVRDAVGHANVSITSAYLHVAVEDEGVGELFEMHAIGSSANRARHLTTDPMVR